MEAYIKQAEKLVAARPDLTARMPPQQLRVCTLLAAGLDEKEIGQMIGRSRHTVHDHTKRVYSALGVNNRAHLILRFTMEAVL